jgi:DNA-binding MarR family transcriptional regulator
VDQLLKDHFIKTLINTKKMLMLITANMEIPFAEIAILMHIRHLHANDCENDGVCVTGIKDQTHISLPAVSRQLSSLEQKGLIERNTMAKDRRITLVTLTPAGEKIIEKVIEQRDLHMEKLSAEVGDEYIRKYIEMSGTIMRCLEYSDLKAE